MKIEAYLVSHLSEAVGYTVRADVPNPRPERLVTVSRTGGGSDSTVLDRPTVAVQCWAPTRSEAADMALEVESVMDALPETPWCTRSEKNSDYYFPGEGGEPRWQLVYDLVCYR